MRYVLALLLTASPALAQTTVIAIGGVKTIPFDPNPGKKAVPTVPAPPPKRAPVGPQHTHRCPRCGTEWSHGHDSFGNISEHTCPRCGAVQWQVHRQGSTLLPSIGGTVVPRSTPYCPSGNCPVPGRFSFGGT